MRTTHKTVTTLAAAAFSVLLVAGCSDSADSSAPAGAETSMQSSDSADASTEFNDADVMFATMMYPHHAQAVEMADMVDGRTTNPDVVALADEITAAQNSEMEQFTTWLDAWGQPAPSADMGSMEDMDHRSMGGMDHGSGMGMMSAEDMDSLNSLEGAAFDREWLTMMIEHHEGAVTMAETEIEDGADADAIELARTIVDTQNAEIERMNELLG